MDDALAEWLRLREEADHQSRSPALLEAIAATLPAGGAVRVLDLATGTGSNLRYLVPRLPSPQHWTVVDRSPVLLAHLLARTTAWARGLGLRAAADDGGCMLSGAGIECRIEIRVQDLGSLDAPALFDGRHLVTASALLDLVSAAWLDALAVRCRHAGASALFTITYDGRATSHPVEPEDEQVRVLFNRHQARDKGLGGPAAGPAATEAAVRAFQAAGFSVRTAQSDWRIPSSAHEFQRQLIDGWAGAATEVAPELAETIAAWRTRRVAHVVEGRSRLTVGHYDLAAWTAR
jgi:SAM-dependent methyltransferase